MFKDCNYTKSELKIVNYIRTHTDRFILMTNEDLARELSVSEATISRFSKKAGFADFKSLRRAVLEDYKNITPSDKLEKTILDQEKLSLSSLLLKQAQFLEKTLEKIDEDQLEASLDAILRADTIYIHGKSSSRAVAELLNFRLNRFDLNVKKMTANGSEIAESLAGIGKDDVVIFFASYSFSRETRLILDYSKKVGFKTICFTSMAQLPEKFKPSYTLFAYRGSEDEYHSQTVPVALADAIVVLLAQRFNAKSRDKMNRIDTLKKLYRKY